MCSLTPPSTPPRSTSPVEATLIDELPESPTAAVPVRSEVTPEPARPIRRSVALVVVFVPAGAVAGSRAIVSLPDDGSAQQATVTIAFPPGLSTGQELTVALEV